MLFKSNQTQYGVFHVELEWKTKSFFGIACLEKKLAFHTEICYYFKKAILKIGLFHQVKELVKSNQTRYGEPHGCLESKTKIIFAIACLEKSSDFNRKFAIISNRLRLLNFKIRSFLSGVGVVQIELNLVLSIPFVSRVQNKEFLA